MIVFAWQLVIGKAISWGEPSAEFSGLLLLLLCCSTVLCCCRHQSRHIHIYHLQALMVAITICYFVSWDALAFNIYVLKRTTKGVTQNHQHKQQFLMKNALLRRLAKWWQK